MFVIIHYKEISVVDCGEGDLEEVEDCNTQGCPGREFDVISVKYENQLDF